MDEMRQFEFSLSNAPEVATTNPFAYFVVGDGYFILCKS